MQNTDEAGERPIKLKEPRCGKTDTEWAGLHVESEKVGLTGAGSRAVAARGEGREVGEAGHRREVSVTQGGPADAGSVAPVGDRAQPGTSEFGEWVDVFLTTIETKRERSPVRFCFSRGWLNTGVGNGHSRGCG